MVSALKIIAKINAKKTVLSCFHVLKLSMYMLIAGESASFFFATDPEVDRESHLAIQIQSCLDTFFLIAFRTVYVEGAGENEGNVEYSALVQHVGLKDEAKQFAYR